MTLKPDRIYCGDCLDLMREMPDKSVDLVLTSPPFKEEDVDGDYWTFYDQMFGELCRISKNAVLIIHSATKLNYLISRYPPKRTMIWGKGVVLYSWRWNPILVYQMRDDYKVNRRIWSDAFGISPICGGNKAHRYQDPDLLYVTLLRMFSDCDTVLDPFLGSGTTAIACLRTGRHFIGIEKHEPYYLKAQERVDKERAQARLFDDQWEAIA